jgi:hypothetical protein
MTVRKACRGFKDRKDPPDRKGSGVLKDRVEASESWDPRGRKESRGFKE